MSGGGRIVSSNTIRLGTRGSKLALIQATTVRDLIQETFPDLTVEIVTIRTSGDRGEREVLGAFVKEIQESLFRREIDVALHCLKDLPTTPVQDLCFAAHLPREDASDALISRDGALSALPEASVVGTGSLRRTSQLAALRPDLTFKPLVGNVDTRMRRLMDGEYDAIVLATAGLKRLGLLEDWSATPYSSLQTAPLDILPAPGQAVLVLETRNDSPTQEPLSALNNLDTEHATIAERAFLRYFGTGCSMPIGAFAEIRDGLVHLEGAVISPDGKQTLRGLQLGEPIEAALVGSKLAAVLTSRGARELLQGDSE